MTRSTGRPASETVEPIEVDDQVRHVLYPELGTGTVIERNNVQIRLHQLALVEWPSGQTTKHWVGSLRHLDQAEESSS